MTLATKITFFRVATIPIFIFSFIHNGAGLHSDWGKIVATLVFVLGAVSDYYDGVVARWYKEETTFGKFIDPIADKLLVTAALVTMVEYRHLTFTPGWAVVIIISREFAVSGLRLVSAPRGKVIEASPLGKWKTATQFIAIITSLVFLSFRILIETFSWKETGEWFLPIQEPIVTFLMILAVILTLVSGYDYFKKNWHLLNNQ